MLGDPALPLTPDGPCPMPVSVNHTVPQCGHLQQWAGTKGRWRLGLPRCQLGARAGKVVRGCAKPDCCVSVPSTIAERPGPGVGFPESWEVAAANRNAPSFLLADPFPGDFRAGRKAKGKGLHKRKRGRTPFGLEMRDPGA